MEFGCNNIEFNENYDPCAPVEIDFFREVSCIEHKEDGTFAINGRRNQQFLENTYTENGLLQSSKIGTSFNQTNYEINFNNIVGTDRFGNILTSVKIDQRIINTYSGQQSDIALVEKRTEGGFSLIAFHNFPNVSSGPDGVESTQNAYLHILNDEGFEVNRIFIGRISYVDPPTSGDTYVFYRKIINLLDGGTRLYFSIVTENSINSTERSETFYIDVNKNFAASPIQDDEFDCDFGPHGYRISNTICDLNYKFNNVCWGGNGLVSSYEVRDYSTAPYRVRLQQNFDRSYSAGIEWHQIDFFNENSTFSFSNQVAYLDEQLLPGDHDVLLTSSDGISQAFEDAYLVGDPYSIHKTGEEAYKILSTKNGLVALSTINCPDCDCPEIDEPVCGYNGEVYANSCEAECAGEFNYYEGSDCDENLPDLSITDFCCIPEQVSLGDRETFLFDVSNDGQLDLDANILIHAYLSTDKIKGNQDDIFIGERILQFIPAGPLSGLSAEIYFISIELGTYYLILDVDPNNIIRETNEQNNFWISSETVTIEAQPLVSPPDECINMLTESDQTVCVTALEGSLQILVLNEDCLLYTSPSPRDATLSRMPSSA